MKRIIIKAIQRFDFSMLYSLVILLYVFQIYHSNSILTQPSFGFEQSESLITQRLLPQTTPAEQILFSSTIGSSSCLIRSEHDGNFMVDVHQKLLFHVFSQYYIYAQNVAHLLQSTDIIFPFHYFW